MRRAPVPIVLVAAVLLTLAGCGDDDTSVPATGETQATDDTTDTTTDTTSAGDESTTTSDDGSESELG